MGKYHVNASVLPGSLIQLYTLMYPSGSQERPSQFCPFKLDLEPMEISLKREEESRMQKMRDWIPKSDEPEDSPLRRIKCWDSVQCATELVEAVKCNRDNIHKSLCQGQIDRLLTCQQNSYI